MSICNICGSNNDYILCFSEVVRNAEISTNDDRFDHPDGLAFDGLSPSVLLHICFDCNHVIHAEIDG